MNQVKPGLKPSTNQAVISVNEDYFKEEQRLKSFSKAEQVEDVYKSFKAGEQISAQQERTRSEDNFRRGDIN